jgi:hypothetical protein
MTAHQPTAEQLRALAELYQEGQTSDLMDRTLAKLLQHEAQQSLDQLRQFQVDLAEFERQYHLSSQEFYQRFQTGQTSDDMDFVEWASLIQMVENLKKRIQILQVGEPT